ncbi:MAG: molybdopterin converting factor small subunit [Roseivirga sp.]|jgi:molybdopterin converting factor small subunit
MAKISFTSALKTFFPDLRDEQLTVDNLEDLIDQLDSHYQGIRGYLVNDQGQVREHVKFYVDNEPIEFNEAKDLSLADSKQIHIMQAISGG